MKETHVDFVQLRLRGGGNGFIQDRSPLIHPRNISRGIGHVENYFRWIQQVSIHAMDMAWIMHAIAWY